mmetsp:Transcript_17893/g.44918  ORF Transcript_17893/g.44918 Transcript_17893/m.44918 type:complete len:270 (+) Transcript_17893:39-848(+)
MLSLDENSRCGQLVVGVAPLMPVAELVRDGDVLMRIDDHVLADDGTVEAMHGLRLPWEFLITRRPVEHQITVELLRDGNKLSGQVRLVAEPRLVPFHHQVDASPSYVIIGGLVFVALTLPLIEEGHLEAIADAHTAGLMLAKLGNFMQLPEQQVVILSKVLESEATIGYENACIGKQLEALNGAEIRNLKDLAANLVSSRTRSEKFLHFRFQGNCRAVLETARARREDTGLLRAHDIYRWCSVDVDPHENTSLLPCTAWLCGGSPQVVD